MKDATGQALAYVYARETRADTDIAKVLTMDEARRIAINGWGTPALCRTFVRLSRHNLARKDA